METSKEPGRVVQILLTLLVFKATRMLGLGTSIVARTQRVAALLAQLFALHHLCSAA